MERAELIKTYKKYNLSENDVFKHKHYLIITRSGIEKIQAIDKIQVHYDVIRCEPDYAVIKAYNTSLSTFGSAKYGDFKTGNTNSWYVAEMAEKRALSRLVLKTCGFYELGVFGEDESEDFKESKEPLKPKLVIDSENWVKVVNALKTKNFRSEEHTSELQSRLHLVCRLLLEKKNNKPHKPECLVTRTIIYQY